MNIDSKSLEEFGINCVEATRRCYIQKGSRINFKTGNIIQEGWECSTTGQNFQTQYEAVKAHFEVIKNEEMELDEREQLFHRNRKYIERLGYLCQSVRQARQKAWDWEDLLDMMLEDGKIKQGMKSELLDSFAGQIIYLKRRA